VDGNVDEQSEEEMTLEQRLARLDQIVASLDGGDVEIERGLALFEEGVRHVREAEALLSRAELRVEELVRQDSGESKLEPGDMEDT
jgi:exodeoxyribonuclease VII small subunit